MLHYVLLNLYLVDSSFSNIKLKFFWLNCRETFKSVFSGQQICYNSDITKSAETYF